MFINVVKKYVKKFELFNPGERVLVCVSGGVDSVVLLEVMEELAKDYKLKLFISHYNHGIRKDSIEDVKFVYTLSKKKQIPMFLSAAPVQAYAKREKLSLEMAGRELRYNAWYRLCSLWDLQKIVLAHHLDDLAEEIFMKLIKGAGKRGLAGIPVKRENVIVRPLLFVTKEEIEQFARDKGLSWREDYTNKDLRFVRNKIRHLLIPFLEKNFNKNIKKAIKKTALIIAEEEEFIEELAREEFEKIKFLIEGQVALRLFELRQMHPVLRKRIYFIAFKAAGIPIFRITYTHLESIESLVLKGKKGPVFLPGDFKVYRGPGYLLFTRQVFGTPYFEVVIDQEGEYELPEGSIVKVQRKKITSDWIPPINSVVLCAEKLDFPIKIRRRKPGDRIFLPKVGHKKLKKLFLERDIPTYLRDKILILERNGEIISVWGIYTHPDYQVKSDCKEVLVFQKRIKGL